MLDKISSRLCNGGAAGLRGISSERPDLRCRAQEGRRRVARPAKEERHRSDCDGSP